MMIHVRYIAQLQKTLLIENAVYVNTHQMASCLTHLFTGHDSSVVERSFRNWEVKSSSPARSMAASI